MPTDASQPSNDTDQQNTVPNELTGNELSGTVTYVIELDAELVAAAVGWQKAQRIQTTNEALSELIRLGLLSEISHLHDLVASIRDSIKK